MLKPYTRNILLIHDMYKNTHLKVLQKKQLDKILRNCLFHIHKHNTSCREKLCDVLEHTDKYNIVIQDYYSMFHNAEAEIDIYSPRVKDTHMYRIEEDNKIINKVCRMSEYSLMSDTVYIITTNLKSISQIRSLVRGY